MRKYRRLTTALLALALVIGWVVPGFTAATVNNAVFSDISGDDNEAAMVELGSLGIYQGDGTGKGAPGDTLTRLQQIVVVVRMLGKGALAEALASSATGFKDDASIASWGKGHVNVGLAMGLLNPQGMGNGNFKPNDPVTQAQVLAMLVRALKMDSFIKGNWPTNYLVAADDLGLTDGVDVFANIPATRGEMAKLVSNAIHTDKRYDADTGDLTEDNDTVLAKVQQSLSGEDDVEFVNAGDANNNGEINFVNGIDLNGDGDTIDAGEDALALADAVTLVGAASLNDIVKQKVKVLVNSDDEITHIEVVGASSAVEGIFANFEDENGDEQAVGNFADGDSIVLDDDTTKELTTDEDDNVTTEVVINGTVQAGPDRSYVAEDDAVRLTLNASGEVTRIDVTRRDVASVRLTIGADDLDLPDDDEDLADNYSLAANDVDAGALNVEVILDDTEITINGAAATIRDIEENDIANLYYLYDAGNAVDSSVGGGDGDLYKLEITRQTVSGTATGDYRLITGADAYYEMDLTVNGAVKTYRVAGEPTIDDGVTVAEIQTAEGLAIEFALDADGYLRRTVTAPDTSDFALVTGHTAVAGDEDIVKVDQLGTAKTFQIDDDADLPTADSVGQIGTLTTATGSGMVTNFVPGVTVTNAGDDDEITWWALEPGVTIEIQANGAIGDGDGNFEAGELAIAGQAVTVDLDGDAAATTAEVLAAIAGSVAASDLLVGTVTGNDGAGGAATAAAVTAVVVMGEVVSIDATNDIITLKSDDDVLSVNAEDYVVYQNDDDGDDVFDIGDYIGRAGLAAGDVVYYQLDADGNAAIIIRAENQDLVF